MKFGILANQNFTLSPSVSKVAEIETDYGDYTDNDNQSIIITIPDNYETILYNELLYNDDCIEFNQLD